VGPQQAAQFLGELEHRAGIRIEVPVRDGLGELGHHPDDGLARDGAVGLSHRHLLGYGARGDRITSIGLVLASFL
jgi:hypothetical protein